MVELQAGSTPPTVRIELTIRPAHEFIVRSAAGRHARTTVGLAPAETNGTHSIPEECAPPASIDGLRPNAYRVAAGRPPHSDWYTE